MLKVNVRMKNGRELDVWCEGDRIKLGDQIIHRLNRENAVAIHGTKDTVIIHASDIDTVVIQEDKTK